MSNAAWYPRPVDPARKLATYEDLERLDESVRAELVGGDIVVTPSPVPAHQLAVGAVHYELLGPFSKGKGGPGGWWFVLDVDVSFGRHDVYRPDISGWRRDRVADFPRERPVGVIPDWICEGLSPGTAAIDQGAKRATYHRTGVPWYWILDPHHRTLTILERGERGYTVERTVGDRGPARLPPFDAVELELSDLFPPPLPSEG